MPDRQPEIVAHRGYSAVAPENTLAALAAALDAGATSLEWDLRTARDGSAVLFHDETLERTTDGKGPMDHLSASELAELDAGGWFGERFRGEPVPSLEDALTLVRARASRLYPEIKAFHDTAELLDILRAVKAHGLTDRTTFISMEWRALEILREAEPGLEVGYIVERASRFFPALERVDGNPASILELDYRIVLADPAVSREALGRGVELAVWTVDDPDDAQRLLELGVTRFTTNQVSRMLEWGRALRH